MTLLYVEPIGGAAGDMMLAALLDLGADEGFVRAQVRAVLGDQVDLQRGARSTGGIQATTLAVTVGGAAIEDNAHLVVDDHHAHDHRHHDEIVAQLRGAGLDPQVRDQALAVYQRLAVAEGGVHGQDPATVAFHEVGALDAIADIVGVCAALVALEVEQLVVAPIPLGHGFVMCAHGRTPVPVPATVALLHGLDTIDGGNRGEMVTPTGAAILSALGQSGPRPAMRSTRVGYGAGRKSWPDRPNVVRVTLAAAEPHAVAPEVGVPEAVVELVATIDDQPAEALAHAAETLMDAGALDVTLRAVTMKRGRLGTELTVLAAPAQAAALRTLVFRETTSLGVRTRALTRHVLRRGFVEVEVRGHVIPVKQGYAADGSCLTSAPEHRACAAAARALGIPLKAVYEAALVAAHQAQER